FAASSAVFAVHESTVRNRRTAVSAACPLLYVAERDIRVVLKKPVGQLDVIAEAIRLALDARIARTLRQAAGLEHHSSALKIRASHELAGRVFARKYARIVAKTIAGRCDRNSRICLYRVGAEPVACRDEVCRAVQLDRVAKYAADHR